MPNYILRLTALFAVLVGLALVSTLQASEKQGANDKQAKAVKPFDRQIATQNLAQAKTELDELLRIATPNHPGVKRLESVIQLIEDALDSGREIQGNHWRRKLEVLQQPKRGQEHHVADKHGQKPKRDGKPQGPNQERQKHEKIQHVRRAIEHLHAADLHDFAEMLERQVGNRLGQREHNDHRRSTHEHRVREFNHKHEYGANGEVRHMIHQLGQAIQGIERRVRHSEEIRQAVEETHRNMHHIQRELELRFREIDQVVTHHARDAERFIEEHSGKFEEAIEEIERHTQRHLGELEERLDDLYEYFEHEIHGDDEHERHHHGDHEHGSEHQQDREEDHEHGE